jgi:uncharacterized protein YneF (UPF0154 family)
MKKLLLKIIIVIACVVGFAFGGAFIGLEAYDLHLTGRHYSGWMGGVGEALLGLCIGAIIGGVVGYKIIKAKLHSTTHNNRSRGAGGVSKLDSLAQSR